MNKLPDFIKLLNKSSITIKLLGVNILVTNMLLAYSIYLQYMKEAYRVLKEGGVSLISIPFHSKEDTTVKRAELINDEIKSYF